MATLVGCNQSGLFFKIDPNTGAGTQVGPIGFTATNSLARDASGVLYSVPGPLITIDRMTGAGTFVRYLQEPTDVRGLAFSPANVLFAIRNNDPLGLAQPFDLVIIDVPSGAVKLVGSTGMRPIQALTFSPNGTLYGWSLSSGLVTIDPNSGLASKVGPGTAAGSVPDIQTLAFAPDGTLYGAREQLFRVDLSTGAATLVGSGGYTDLRGMEFLEAAARKRPLRRIANAAWLWTILAGGILFTPIGPLCIVCGDPLSEAWVRILGAVTIGMGTLGLWGELSADRR